MTKTKIVKRTIWIRDKTKLSIITIGLNRKNIPLIISLNILFTKSRVDSKNLGSLIMEHHGIGLVTTSIIQIIPASHTDQLEWCGLIICRWGRSFIG